MRSEVAQKTAIVLLQLGGPDNLDAVEPFLYNLFCDPDIIDLPGAFLFRKGLARLISSRRSPAVRELYKNIGGRSPILPQTEEQAQALQLRLDTSGHQCTVFIAMRYWHPMTDAIARSIAQGGYDRILLLPLYPHYCKATTGSGINEWRRCAKKYQIDHIPTQTVASYFDHPDYIHAIVDNIKKALTQLPEDARAKTHLVFSAHGTPMKLVRDGDPYSIHIRRTYEAVLSAGNFGLPHHLCFQSKVGPQQWLEPSLVQTIADLSAQKVSHMLVVPVAFVTEHIETLSEINIEVRHEAEQAGVRYFDMMPALRDHPSFTACLYDLTLKALHGAWPVSQS
ncbi:MAG TPA: ferrochelatase [bacterium]|nr:ferrochelatase [bacterium]HMW32317.1 ferrochelatase [bacterium]HMZ05057.1 ferrochelatase [bacterium]HNB57697.1 ferrochelatase [bacterium]HND77976.1 ferrochelatase [bacterium]